MKSSRFTIHTQVAVLAFVLAVATAGVIGSCATAGNDDDRPDASLRRADSGPRLDAQAPADAGPDATPIGTDSGAGGNVCTDNNDCIDIACCDDEVCVLGVKIGDDICVPVS